MSWPITVQLGQKPSSPDPAHFSPHKTVLFPFSYHITTALEPSFSFHSCQTNPVQTLFISRQKHTHPPPPPAHDNPEASRTAGRSENTPEMSADELRLELDDLRRLEGLAKHPRVQTLLANEIRNVEAKVAPFLLPFYFSPSSPPIFSFSPPISFGAWMDSDPFLPIVSLRCLIAAAMAVGEGNRTVAGATGGGFRARARARGASCFKLRHVGVVQLGPGQREDKGTLLLVSISFVPSIGLCIILHCIFTNRLVS